MDWNSPSIDRTYNMAIPVFSVIFVWLKWKRLKTTPIRASFWGLPLVLFGVAVRLAAEPGQVNFLKYTSLVFVLAGVVWTIFGTRMFVELLFPLAYLVFMAPVPDPIYQRMSVPMMTYAAKAGYSVVKLLGIDATLAGRQITIMPAGALKEQLPMSVAEACSGMRSLFTLTAVAVAFAYITRRDLGTRLLLSLSAIPIAVGMNMMRVAGVGVLAVTMGQQWASGLYHEGEGWVTYLVEIVLLFGVGWLISWIFGKPSIEWGRSEARKDAGTNSYPYSRRISMPALVCAALLIVTFPLLYKYHEDVKRLSAGVEPKIPFETFAGGRQVKPPLRTTKDEDPPAVPTDSDLVDKDYQYIGFPVPITDAVLKTAELDAHINVLYLLCPPGTKPEDARADKTESVNAYVAFHKSASSGINRGAIHHPDQCYPGQGYETAETSIVKVKTPGYCGGYTEMARSVFYNERGEWLLVYYHMNNNGTNVVDRSAGKIDNFFKLMMGKRTGFLAQVHFTTAIGRGMPVKGGISEEEIKRADERLQEFCPLFLKKLDGYLPDPVK
jgi:exosortase